tara:strand:+ start:94 stop:393 length:300 start_codon:yes stop_codon:yes gene_type:complete
MFVVIVNFKTKDNDSIKDKFIESAPLYKETQGLIRKNYLINKDTNTAGGVYIFDTAENAYNWFDPERIAYLSERYSEPDIKYFESPVEVNNENHKINIH